MAQKIIPNLWFDKNAQAAVDYYVSVFPNSKILSTSHYPTDGLADFQKDYAGEVLTIEFELDGQQYLALNGGPDFHFTEAVSFVVQCSDQAEIDYYWEKLSSVAEAEQCGWCKDQFGLSWQITPSNIGELMQKPGAFEHMMKMKKLK